MVRSAELIAAREATPDQLRGALAPQQACRLSSDIALGGRSHGADMGSLRALVEDAVGLGPLRWLDGRALIGLLEDQLRRARLLVVPVPESRHAVLPILAAEAVAVAAAASAAPASSPRPPPPPERTSEPELEAPPLDALAQAQVLRQAARLGVPFCEECAAARWQAAAPAGAQPATQSPGLGG